MVRRTRERGKVVVGGEVRRHDVCVVSSLLCVCFCFAEEKK